MIEARQAFLLLTYAPAPLFPFTTSTTHIPTPIPVIVWESFSKLFPDLYTSIYIDYIFFATIAKIDLENYSFV